MNKKSKIKGVLSLAVFSVIFAVAYGNGKGSAVPRILSFKPFSGNVMEMVVNTTDPANSYPKATTNLNEAFVGVPHSTNGVDYLTTNLTYSASSDTNYVIYVQVTDSAKFFGIGPQ